MSNATLRAFLLVALLAPGAAWARPAEDSGLRGPVMGYVLDPLRNVVRPLNGIPGSSLLGEPLELSFPVAAAAFSPLGNFGVVVSGSDDRAAYVISNLDGEFRLAVIDGGLIGADRLFLNADGSAGVLLATDARQLQLVRGLPSSPNVDPLIDLSSIPGAITALAVDRTASNILIAVSDDHGALYLASRDQDAKRDSAQPREMRPRLIATFGSPTALALLNGDRDVIVADAAVDQISLLRNFAGSSEQFLLTGGRDGISGPTGLWISQDNQKLYVANRVSRTLAIWSFQERSIEKSFALEASPTRLIPLQGSSVLMLNDVGADPLLLLDADVTPAIYFVPAGRGQ